MNATTKLLAALPLAALLAAPLRAQEGPLRPTVAGEERTKARLRLLRLRIEPSGSAGPRQCLELGPDELKVVLRGQRVAGPDRLELEREQPPAVHALLIDTSQSMVGQLEAVRAAAADYVRELDLERDSALLATFDETVILQQPVTSDRERLLRAIGSVRMGGATSLHDGLAYVIRELDTCRERGVVLLLTDGIDTASLNERHDVLELVQARPELVVFTIGLALPPLAQAAPSGFNSTRRFLQRLAERTHGEFFDAPTPSLLPRVYRRIRESLESEATLTVVDPDPEAEPGSLRVSSTRPGCRVEVLGEAPADAPAGDDVNMSPAELPQTLSLRFGEVWRPQLESAHHAVEAGCDAAVASSVTVEPDRIHGCALDVTMEPGMLYDPDQLGWSSSNDWIELMTRPFEIPLVAPEALPERPEELLDRLAETARSLAERPIARNARQQPAEAHARPYADNPSLDNGRMFFDLRPQLARSLWLHPAYRRYAYDRLQEESRRDVAALERAFKRRLPGATEQAIAAAVRDSAERRRILQRAARPAGRDLERYLAEWLGDLTAHELFVRWEKLRLDRFLAGSVERLDAVAFFEPWRALRRLVYAPSYARVLTLLAPVRDAESGRIGFYRVVLPRPSWFLPRLKGYARHPEWSNLPLDLVPDLPLGVWTAECIFAGAPELDAQLRERHFQVRSLEYALLAKPRKRTPSQAFRATRVVLVLAPPTATAGGEPAPGLTLEADIELDRESEEPRLVAWKIDAHGDPVLDELARAAEPRR